MRVVDHEPQLWYLFEAAGAHFLDVNCSHGPAGYSVLLPLNAEEEAAYAAQGRAYLNGLAQEVQDSGPRGPLQQRSVHAQWSEQTATAFRAWSQSR